MAEKIRVGIVGATVSPSGSRWGANAHVPALHALSEYELKAVCTAHEDTAAASRDAFGAELAFHDFATMVANPEIDVIVVCVRVPAHHDLVMAALRAGKAVFCEWPLGANLAEAEEMAALARERGLRTAVGLQARSDPAIRYARELVADGYIGEVLTASLSVIGQATVERTPDRIWQGQRVNGANPLTIAGGHAIDALCAILGEFTDVSARIATRIKEWRLAGSGESVAVDAPDAISASGRLESGAEVAIQVATVPSSPSGNRLTIYGREGTLVLTSGSANIGPNQLHGAKGREPATEMPPPDRLSPVPEGTPAGQARNVAQAYVRLADSLAAAEPFDPDFELAVRRHRLLDAMERSAAGGRSISLP